MTLPAFITTYRVRLVADLTDHNPTMDEPSSDWSRTATHWRCQLRCQRRQLTVFFSMGPALSREPTTRDVLECLLSDAAGFENAQSFNDWADNYGYDVDSRRAERTYRVIERQAEGLRRLLGEDAYQIGLWKTDHD